VQRAHIHVDPKWLALMFHVVEIIVISFCKLVHIHMFPKSLAFQENCTTLLFLAKLLKHPTNHHHPHPLIPPNSAFMSMRAHYLQMKKIIWSYIQIWMMYSSRCVLCPFDWEKNSNKLGMNDACVVFLDKVFEKEYAKVINFFFLHHAYNFLQTISYYSKIFTMIQTLTSCAQRLLVCKGFGFV